MTKRLPEAPDYLPDNVKAIWYEVVAAYGPGWAKITGPALDAYCGQVSNGREARRRVAAEGLVIEGPRGAPVPHPAIAIEKAAQDEVRKWATRFVARPAVRRRRGAMYDATRRSVAAAPHLRDSEEYAGAVEAVYTLAWLIDEAQREGIDTLQRAAFGTIPSYLKGCSELQITPGSVPVVGAVEEKNPRSKVSKLQVLQGGA